MAVSNSFKKAVNAEIKVRHHGPKAPSFNLSAREYVLAFIVNGETVLIEGEKAQRVAALRKMLTLKGDGYVLRDNVTPFIYIRGFEKDEAGVMHSLVDVKTSRLLSNTLVQRNSENHLVRDLCEFNDFEMYTRQNNDRKVIETSVVKAFDNTKQLNFRVVPVVEELAFMLTKEFAKLFKMSLLELAKIVQKFILNGIALHNGEELVLYTPNSASPAQTRKGEAAFYEFARANRPTLEQKLKDHNLRVTAVYSRFNASFELSVYGGEQDGKWKFKIDKDPKRLDMAASGSRFSTVMEALFGEMEIIREGDYTNGVGKKEHVTVLQSKHKMLNGRKRRIILIGDMMRTVTERAVIVQRAEMPKLIEEDIEFVKNMTDGGILFSEEVAYYLKQEGNMKDEGQSVQARGANGLKPFAYGTYKLRQMTGADMVFMDGAMKLDLLPSLLDGSFKLSIVQASRMEEEEDMALVATQALLAMDVPQKNMKLLNMFTASYVKSAPFDGKMALKLLNVESDYYDKMEKGDTSADEDADAEEVEVEVEEEEIDKNVMMDDVLIDIKDLLSTNPEIIKDMAVKRKVQNLLTKPLEKIKKGGILVKDAKMRHMGFDIFMVVKAIQGVVDELFDGKEPVVKYVDSIPAGCAIVVDSKGNLRRGYFLAVRYPILKKEEVRKVLAVDTLANEEAMRYYVEAAKAGFFKGLVLFNSVDMTTEAMSGADFDGDTCLVIFNQYVVNSFKNKVKMLDFFKDENGEVEGGCPWARPEEAPDVFALVGDFIEANKLNVEQEVVNGSRTWTLKFDKADVLDEERAKLVYYVFNRMAAAHIVATAKVSSIGKWTNRLMNVEDILLDIQRDIIVLSEDIAVSENAQEKLEMTHQRYLLAVEYGNYEDIANWLVCIVRWAIDEAKHGGAFDEPLSHIVDVFETNPTPEELLYHAKSEHFFPVRLFV